MTTRPTPSAERTLARRTCAALLIVGLGAALALTVLTLKNFERILSPQVILKSSVIASSVRATIQSAIELGIPFESLVGMDDFLADTLLDNAEIEFIQVKDMTGHAYTKHRDGSNQRRQTNEILEEIHPEGIRPGVTIGVRASYVEENYKSCSATQRSFHWLRSPRASKSHCFFHYCGSSDRSIFGLRCSKI